MAQRDSRVLYVSLESVAASAFFEPDSDQRFSQLLYYLQTNPATINDKLAQFVASDPHYRFDYLPPLGSYAEAQEMSAQDSKGLLAALVDRGTYDYVVVDLESSLHPRVIGALEHSDRIFWLVTDDISCLRKTEMMLCEWERNGLACIDQVLFISNKFLGMQTNDFGAIRIHESATLPYVPQWKTVQSAQQLVSVAFYNEQLWNVFLAVTGRRKAG
jgi:cellulose biosynthesis protein BcsQ